MDIIFSINDFVNLKIFSTYHAALLIQVYVIFWCAARLKRRRKDICTGPTESYVICKKRNDYFNNESRDIKLGRLR